MAVCQPGVGAGGRGLGRVDGGDVGGDATRGAVTGFSLTTGQFKVFYMPIILETGEGLGPGLVSSGNQLSARYTPGPHAASA